MQTRDESSKCLFIHPACTPMKLIYYANSKHSNKKKKRQSFCKHTLPHLTHTNSHALLLSFPNKVHGRSQAVAYFQNVLQSHSCKQNDLVRLTLDISGFVATWKSCMQMNTHTHEHTQHLRSNIFFMSSPRSFICGLLCSAMITSHTTIKASLVHLPLKQL